MLPASGDAEQGVICSFLLAPQAIGEMCTARGVEPEHFHTPALAGIYRKLMEMWSAKVPIDVVTLIQGLYDDAELELCGGPAFVSQLFTFLPTAANASHYLDILEQKWTARKIIQVGTEYASRGYETGEEIDGLLSSFQRAAIDIRKLVRKPTKTMKELTMSVIEEFQNAFEKGPGQITGLSTGYPSLDEVMNGLSPGDMFVLAGRPSHGKTALMLNIVAYLAITLRLPILIFSLEMRAQELVKRLICQLARVNFYKFRDGFAQDRDFPALTAAANQLAESRIFIEDSSNLSIQEAAAISRRRKQEDDIQAVFIDYLQLLRSSSSRAKDNRAQEVAEISLGCKGIARDNDIPVTVLAQIDRSVDKQMRKPRLSDLRESGAIEQDADKVAFVTRPELYAENEDEMEALQGKATISVAKHRNGPLGDKELIFIKEFTRFEEPYRGPEEHQETLIEVPQTKKPRKDPREAND